MGKEVEKLMAKCHQQTAINRHGILPLTENSHAAICQRATSIRRSGKMP